MHTAYFCIFKYDTIGGKTRTVLNTSLFDFVSTSFRVSASILGNLGNSLEVVASKCLTSSNGGDYINGEDEAHLVEQVLKTSL